MTMYRMRQRELDPRRCWRRALELRRSLLDLADRHRETVFAVHTHTQRAQPTTVAHYLLAVIEQLERDAARLQARVRADQPEPARRLRHHRHGVSDRSAAHRGAARLLPARPATPTAASRRSTTCSRARRRPACCSSGLGRFVQDLLLWSHRRVRLPAARRRLRAVRAASCRRSATRSRSSTRAPSAARRSARRRRSSSTVHNTPFGDIVDTEDDLQPLVFSMFRDATRALKLVGRGDADGRLRCRRGSSARPPTAGRR